MNSLILVLLLASAACGVFAIRSRASKSARLTPLRLFLPLFLVYNLAGLLANRYDDKLSLLFLILLAAVSFAVGSGLGFQRASFTAPEAGAGHLNLRPAAYASLLMGAGVYLLLVVRAGAVPLFSGNANYARTTFFPNGVYSTLTIVPLTATLTASIVALLSGGNRKGPFFAIAISFLLLAGTANRGLLVEPVVVAALFALWVQGGRARYLLGGGVLSLGLFSLLGYARNLQAYGPTYIVDLSARGYSGSLRYFGPLLEYVAGTSETLSRTLAYFPERRDFTLGVQFFGPLLHQPSVDLYLKSVFNLQFEGFGLAVGAINALYIDWGTTGVAAGFFCFGLISQLLFQTARVRGNAWIVGYCLWTANLLLSNYGHPFAYLATILTPALILLLLVKTGSPNRVLDFKEPARYPKARLTSRR